MNHSKRPEQVHYIPPNRRKNSISIPPPMIPPPPQPGVGPIYVNGSSGRVTVDSPGSKHAVPVSHGRFEPSKTPPLRPDNVKPHPHSRSQNPRREVYEPAMSPGMHHRELPVRVDVFREHSRPTAAEPFYNDKAGGGVFQIPASGAAGRNGVSPAHLVRNRSYEQDRYAEVPAPFRKQAAPAGWMDGVVKGNPAVMHPVRILRNPEREREQRERDRDRENRDFPDEHVAAVPSKHSRAFVMPPRPEVPMKPRIYGPTNGGGGAFLGEKIHSLTPLTSLEERCKKFINSLNPEHPDPPLFDDYIEHPYTEPCDPSTLPPRDGGSNRGRIMDDERYAPVEVKTIPGPHFRSFVPSERDIAGMGRRGRHGRPRHRTHRRDDDYDTDEECARGMYRLHT